MGTLTPCSAAQGCEYGHYRASKSDTTIFQASDKLQGIAVHNELLWFSECML